MTKFLDYLKKHPLLTAALAVAIAATTILTVPQESYWVRLVLRVLMCGTMLFLLWLISGEKTLSQCSQQTWTVLKNGTGILILALITGVLSFLTSLKDAGGMPEGWVLRTVLLFFMFLFACLFEELCFRAIINDAILYRFRSAKHVFFWSALISSVIFGAVHNLGASLTSPSDWAQAALKLLQCAIIGFAFLILYWKTRNIWACGILHGLYDFLCSPGLIFMENAKIGAGTYVVAGEEASSYILFAAGDILLCLLVMLLIWHKVGKTIDFEDLRKTW